MRTCWRRWRRPVSSSPAARRMTWLICCWRQVGGRRGGAGSRPAGAEGRGGGGLQGAGSEQDDAVLQKGTMMSCRLACCRTDAAGHARHGLAVSGHAPQTLPASVRRRTCPALPRPRRGPGCEGPGARSRATTRTQPGRRGPAAAALTWLAAARKLGWGVGGRGGPCRGFLGGEAHSPPACLCTASWRSQRPPL
jgi:hypothetical protein